jgi:7-cyano-7-deazaguanine synthase
MNTIKKNKLALVVLSGGQDSVTCLGWALATYERVSAISFHYNQRHEVELGCAALLCQKYKVPHKLVEMGTLLTSLVTSALTGVGEVGLPHAYKPGLPSSFVPGRNALFLTLAHAHAQEIKADLIITGVCETDYSGYPDCREVFVSALGVALNIGYETKIPIVTPLMHLNKAETFALAEHFGFLQEVIENSHTCYKGDHSTKHEWGYGCGECPACVLRKAGYDQFMETPVAPAGIE